MARLNGGQFLTSLTQSDSRLGMLFQSVINGINNVASAAGVDPVGDTAAPSSPNGIQVSTPQAGSGSEMMHVSIQDAGSTTRAHHYFTEISTTPTFSPSTTMVHSHGASRTPPPFHLPTFDNDGVQHQFYVRSYSQLPGSPPSAPIVYGGASNPIPVQMQGTSKLSLLTSAGSGTAAVSQQGTATQAAQGMGKAPARGPSGPKRSVGRS